MPRNKKRLLADAEALIGRKSLAAGLGISVAVLQSWLDGSSEMPDRKLLTLADLLVQLAGNPNPRA